MLESLLTAIIFTILIPVVLVLLSLRFAWKLVLYIAVWQVWCRNGRFVLLVNSNSPIWHDHFDETIVRPIGDRAVVLNWSERNQWRRTLPVMVFRSWKVRREFNPLAIVFHPFRRARVFRFYDPYKQFKHDHPEALEAMTSDLLALVDQIAGSE